MVEIQAQLSSNEQNCIDEMDDEAHSKTLGMRIQGKIASKMATKGLAKQVVDGPTSDLIDNCYRIAKHYLESKKDAEKLMKNLIKIVVKVALLSNNSQFSGDELNTLQEFQRKFKTLAKSVISFHDVDFTFDVEYIVELVRTSQELLTRCVSAHLTDKSLARIESVFGFYGRPDVLEAMFDPQSKYRPYLTNIVQSLNTLIEQGQL